MRKTALLATFLIAAFAPAVLAQTVVQPDKTAIRAKKDSCQAEATARKLDKPQRKAFIAECVKK
jgi:hypothetical protein